MYLLIPVFNENIIFLIVLRESSKIVSLLPLLAAIVIIIIMMLMMMMMMTFPLEKNVASRATRRPPKKRQRKKLKRDSTPWNNTMSFSRNFSNTCFSTMTISAALKIWQPWQLERTRNSAGRSWGIDSWAPWYVDGFECSSPGSLNFSPPPPLAKSHASDV